MINPEIETVVAVISILVTIYSLLLHIGLNTWNHGLPAGWCACIASEPVFIAHEVKQSTC